MPEPTYRERAGERVFNEVPDSRSDEDDFHREMVASSGDGVDAVSNVYDMVQAGLGNVRPTGQHSEVPHGEYYEPDQPGGGSADPWIGLAAGVAMAAEAVRAVRRRRRKLDGDG